MRRRSCARKGLDLIVANDVTGHGRGLCGGRPTESRCIDADGARTDLPLMSKLDVARAILDRAQELPSPAGEHTDSPLQSHPQGGRAVPGSPTTSRPSR